MAQLLSRTGATSRATLQAGLHIPLADRQKPPWQACWQSSFAPSTQFRSSRSKVASRCLSNKGCRFGCSTWGPHRQGSHSTIVTCSSGSDSGAAQAEAPESNSALGIAPDLFPGHREPVHAFDSDQALDLPEDFEPQWSVLPRPRPKSRTWQSDEVKEEYLEDVPSSVRRTVEERFNIRIERQVSKERLQRLKVNQWGRYTLQKGSSYLWKYSACPEVAYIVKGKVKLTPEWSKESAYAEAGDLIVFPKWLSLIWEAEEPMEKRYKFFYKHAPPSEEWYKLEYMSKEERGKHFPWEVEEEAAVVPEAEVRDEADVDEDVQAGADEEDEQEEEEDVDEEEEEEAVIEEDELAGEAAELEESGPGPVMDV